MTIPYCSVLSYSPSQVFSWEMFLFCFLLWPDFFAFLFQRILGMLVSFIWILLFNVFVYLPGSLLMLIALGTARPLMQVWSDYIIICRFLLFVFISRHANFLLFSAFKKLGLDCANWSGPVYADLVKYISIKTYLLIVILCFLWVSLFHFLQCEFLLSTIHLFFLINLFSFLLVENFPNFQLSMENLSSNVFCDCFTERMLVMRRGCCFCFLTV